MNVPQLSPAAYIDHAETLQQLVQQLKEAPLIAVDTESNSMHAYHGRVCLIQVSTRQADYIIDPLKIDNLQPFGDLLADPSIEKIFHAAEYDLICLKRDFGFEIENLFDTMIAARMCKAYPFGLGNLLHDYFGVTIDKSHQLDDWGVRPLPAESLRYAQKDTHYLADLRDLLFEKLEKAGRLAEAQEVFQDVSRVTVRPREFDPEGFWNIGRPRSLTRRQMAILREVYLVRDSVAQQIDLPAYRLISNADLIQLVRRMPKKLNALGKVINWSPERLDAFGDEILQALERGRSSRLPKPPPVKRINPAVAERYTMPHNWRKEQALERGVDSNIVLSKDTLWELAREMPLDENALSEIDGIG